MINSIVIWPIVSALWAAIGFIGGNSVGTLIPVNQDQQQFIDKYVIKQDDLQVFKPNELRSWASTDISYLNNLLKKEGYTIQLEQTTPNAFGVVSVLDIKVQWKNEGECTELTGQNGTVYQAICIDQQDGNVECALASVHNNHIISLRTKSNDVIYMTVLDEKLDEVSMLNLIKRIHTCYYYKREKISNVIFPMIAYNQTINLDWLHGLRIGNGDHYIDQALQQTKLNIDEKGAQAQSACTLCISECLGTSAASTFIIDKPFLLWIIRSGVKEPIFAAYLPYDCWENPNL